MVFSKYYDRPNRVEFEALEKRVAALEESAEEHKAPSKDEVKGVIRNMLYDMVSTETIHFRTTMGNKKIDTKLVANQTKILREKRFALERALEECDKALEIAEGEEA